MRTLRSLSALSNVLRICATKSKQGDDPVYYVFKVSCGIIKKAETFQDTLLPYLGER
jgi:hypothetical protein